MEAIIGFVMTLIADVFCLIPVHNAMVSFVFSSQLVISQFDWQVADVMMFCFMSVPLAAIIFTGIYAWNEITYKAGVGY